MTLKNKKILITAGPTWVAIDPVRVISNIATGDTGKIIAQLAIAKGARVSLLLGTDRKEKIKGVRIKVFRYFQELRFLLSQELKNNRFDCIIHNAAVSDYLLERPARVKIDSRQKKLFLELKKAPKLIDEIRRKSPSSLLVMFKLESGIDNRELIEKALVAQEKTGADIVVANTFKGGKLKSFIYNHSGLLAKACSRQTLAKRLISIVENRL